MPRSTAPRSTTIISCFVPATAPCPALERMQPSPMAETSRPLRPSLRFSMLFLLGTAALGLGRNPYGGRASAISDHRLQIRTGRIFRAVRSIDAVVDLTGHLLEADICCLPGNRNLSCLLFRCSLVPAGGCPVVGPNVEFTVDDYGPYPRRSSKRHTILAERSNMQIVARCDLPKP